MPILRDVLARFAINVDVKPLTEMDRKIEKLKGSIKTVGVVAAASFGVAAAGAWKLVAAASHADESMAALRASFGPASARNIENWSKRVGNALGRSSNDLNDSVLRFGSFLQPQFKGKDDMTVQMSKKLARLSIDLAAFYDTSDEEAQMRLFSGMSGETEAVRKLGIDISDKSLKDLHKKKGGKGAYESLTLAEKTLLRYEKILTDTEKKHGTAAREAQQWAGSLKRVEGYMKDMAVKWGRRLKDTMLSVLRVFEKVLVTTEEWLDICVMRTSTFQTLLLACGVAMGGLVGYAMKLASGIALAKVVAYGWELAAALGKASLYLGAFLILEDIVTFFRGGKSWVGAWTTSLMGFKQPLEAVKEGMAALSLYAYNFGQHLMEAFKLMWRLAKLTPDLLRYKFMSNEEKRKFQTDVKEAASWNPDTIDVGAAEDERNRRKEDAFEENVRTGNLKKAAEFPRLDESSDDAYKRARDRRKQLVERGEITPTKVDLDSGFVPPTWTPKGPVIGGFNSTPQAIRADPSDAKGGNKTVIINVTNADISEDELASKVKEVMLDIGDQEAPIVFGAPAP